MQTLNRLSLRRDGVARLSCKTRQFTQMEIEEAFVGLKLSFPGRDGGFCTLAGPRWAFQGPNGGILCVAGPRWAFPGRNGGFRGLAGPRRAFPGRNGGVRVLGLD